MKRILVLLFFSNLSFAMDNRDVVICIAEQPTMQEPSCNTYFIRQNDMQHWMTTEMLHRDRDFAESIATLKYRLDDLEKKAPTVNNRTKAAMVATALVSVCSAVSAIITFFSEKKTTGSD